jgi:hypothetical protein
MISGLYDEIRPNDGERLDPEGLGKYPYPVRPAVAQNLCTDVLASQPFQHIRFYAELQQFTHSCDRKQIMSDTYAEKMGRDAAEAKRSVLSILVWRIVLTSSRLNEQFDLFTRYSYLYLPMISGIS